MSAVNRPIGFTLRSILVLVYTVFFTVFIGFNFDGFGQLFAHGSSAVHINTTYPRYETFKEVAHRPVKKEGMRLNKRFHPESFLNSDFVLGSPLVHCCAKGFTPYTEDNRFSFVFLFFCLRAPPSMA